MTIVNAFATEERGRNTTATYTCPICDISYGYIKDSIPMNESTHCIKCNFFGRVGEFIPRIVGLDFICAVNTPIYYSKRKGVIMGVKAK